MASRMRESVCSCVDAGPAAAALCEHLTLVHMVGLGDGGRGGGVVLRSKGERRREPGRRDEEDGQDADVTCSNLGSTRRTHI